MSRFYDALQRALESGTEAEQATEKKARQQKVARALEDQAEPIKFPETSAPEIDTDLEEGAVRSPDSTEKALNLELDTLLRGVPPQTSGIQVPIAIQPAYERIVQRLLAYRRSARQNVILVVSAVPSEGASTVARNLSIALAQDQNERVLLVDANLRSPMQHIALHTTQVDGLAEVLTDEASLGAAVKSGVSQGLSLLPSGHPPESPPQLLTQPAFHAVVSALQSQFDWVVIDGPAVAAYPDASTLASASGGAVMVFRAERTRWEVADEAKRVLQQTGVDILGAVLNRRKYHIPGFIYRRL